MTRSDILAQYGIKDGGSLRIYQTPNSDTLERIAFQGNDDSIVVLSLESALTLSERLFRVGELELAGRIVVEIEQIKRKRASRRNAAE